MKVKITSIWIPILMSLVLATVLTLLNLLGILNEANLSVILLITGGILFFFYFPRLAYVAIKKDHPDKENIINYIGLFCVTSWVTGFLFLQYRIPGKMFLLVYSAFIFTFIFLPAWYRIKYKESDQRRKILYFLLGTFYASLMMYALFKTMHYPGGDFLSLAYVLIFCLLVLPYLVFLAIKRDLRFNFKEHFVFVFILAYIISNIQDTRIRERRFSEISVNQEVADKNLNLYTNKNKFLYEAFLGTSSRDTAFISQQKKAVRLRELSEDLDTYIRKLKAVLISRTDEVPLEKADTMKFEHIQKKVNNDVPTRILFAETEDSLNTREYTAVKLRRKLESYTKELVLLLPEESRLQFKQSNPIIIHDNPENVDGQPEAWEVTLFNHRSLGMVFTQLTSIQSDVKYAEMLVLNELFNQANTGNKENVAAQLSNLAAKYESEKKEKEIGLLQKDKELNDSKLQAKDLAISKKEQTIIYFVLALVLFVVMIVFVVRANILRKKANQVLTEQKIEIEKQKIEVEAQKHLVEEKNKEITDSITYAKRLQEAILPPPEFINRYLPSNFILYRPKDLVAGDFYWAEVIGDRFYIAAADSTGHGVPGAMVSVVCSNALNRTVKEFKETETGKILDKTRELVLETFEKSTSEVKDGMDISLLCVDTKNRKITWSGANNPLWYVKSNQLHEIKADKQPIGKTDYPKPFTTHEIPFEDQTTFYLFTDGLADQFGGPNGKKFKYKQLSDFLISINELETSTQSDLIDKRFQEWKGELEQVDDVCIIGLRI